MKAPNALSLIGRYLRAGVLNGEELQPSELGPPCGGPLSPLLANIKHLLALGVGKRQAILTGISSKSWWHLSKTKATQMGMSNEWLKSQGLISVRDLWLKAQGYV